MITAAEIRQSFFDFFEGKQHEIVPSSPVVLPSDPTLLFTNAGMNQFKEIFLGARSSEYKRVADTQKCIRVSGKHNDLEEVGHDTYHHTFFEMLGNWSFGDYYKREAISWAWELLTEVWQLPKDRLWATVYHDDDEAAELWKEVTDIEPERILRFGEKDNFWEMGETGPCGPCSEIHIDLTPDKSGGKLVNAGVPEVIEIWNLVFIQYNRKSDGSLEELPSKHVDTGMGLERVVAVIQGKTSNYDTDLFQPIIRKIEEISGHKYEGEAAIAMRVIADHLRTLAFAIGDGVMPSNDGRGYVLRRLLRRAVRYGRKIDLRDPFMGRLLPVLEDMMNAVFPELAKNRETIRRAIEAEENSFAATLDRGIDLFDSVVQGMKADKQTVFPGDEAFKLYDTFGFPVDLTELMAQEQGFTLDREAFETLMVEQRERARSARKGDALNAEMDQVAALVNEGINSEFTGYQALEEEAKVLAIYADGNAVDSVDEGTEAQVLLDKTPFYAESGGQIGDTGVITGDGVEFAVEDTRKPAAGLMMHVGRVKKGTLKVGDAVRLQVEAMRRAQLQRHHTATHLLNYALRQLVGDSIKQAGSYVAPDRLRFDFNHFEALKPEQLRAVERLVNEKIMANDPVEASEMDLRDVHGSDIVAVFDEKYGDRVRVLNIGGYSKELCGGTHVARTGDIGQCRIVAESSVAAGIRRIEAVCGWSALEWTEAEHDMIQKLAQGFSITWEELPTRISALTEQNKKLEKQLKEQAAKNALAGVDELLAQKTDCNGVALLAADAGEMAMDNLRGVMDTIRQKMPQGIIVLGAKANGKACFMAAVSDELVAQGYHAGKLIGQVAKIAGGGGGGKPQKAQAGGKDASKVPEAIAKVPEIVSAG
jgi:alanyl-tRNA synthetase